MLDKFEAPEGITFSEIWIINWNFPLCICFILLLLYRNYKKRKLSFIILLQHRLKMWWCVLCAPIKPSKVNLLILFTYLYSVSTWAWTNDLNINYVIASTLVQFVRLTPIVVLVLCGSRPCVENFIINQTRKSVSIKSLYASHSPVWISVIVWEPLGRTSRSPCTETGLCMAGTEHTHTLTSFKV